MYGQKIIEIAAPLQEKGVFGRCFLIVNRYGIAHGRIELPYFFHQFLADRIRCVGRKSFSAAGGECKLVVHRLPIGEGRFRSVFLERVVEFHKRIVAQAAARFCVEGIGGIGDIANCHNTAFQHLAFGRFDGVQNAFPGRAAIRDDTKDKGDETGTGVYPAFHVREFQMAVRVYEAGCKHAAADVEACRIVLISGFEGQDRTLVVEYDDALFDWIGTDREYPVGGIFMHSR